MKFEHVPITLVKRRLRKSFFVDKKGNLSSKKTLLPFYYPFSVWCSSAQRMIICMIENKNHYEKSMNNMIIVL